ncbi:hypothetical protein ABB37_04277 [Leptomonas pyrrhocoris]|uniref:Vta1/callose synthase N-terminal domain-containing protein n=1 Tax=Leptomonas pyrrhocoris TaxID=157538 RepID=A0A0M9G2K6_LEPPY|nr:hypothetical protein ABB37_04277 [Leptomonas pyrrhocoris]XP_015659295.1 hypothetical protein ABB37_04277 [Leptomonas pyrrhocoris]KPA80855.1 hypothetical protein ABB37_04277 [Leptomonas pyrrhocoris]KPA80856.1 hypothetical protein ABB37_04277 [Leptomonas pyrrhocoris]|eukprot:XP_015659294.1 hypothetical protein ABB37_04277 [Leptomonas pyrrhocoris]
MSSFVALQEKLPEHWAAMARPYLLRSAEFEDKEPLVAYFLRTHVAFLCMKLRKKDDKAGTAFLMALLETLEADKAKLGARLDGVDGRTTLTRCALMLFARADDAERTGNASMALVRLFYTSALLLEATAQFTPDGNMDAVAAQKCKYAKYIAARMKKALDAKEPYVSPNKIEEVEGGPEAANIGSSGNFTTVPASCFSRPGSNTTAATPPKTTGDGKERMPVLPPPPSPQPMPADSTNVPPPAYTYDSNAFSSHNTSSLPPPTTLQAPLNRNSAVPAPRITPGSNTGGTPSLPAVVGPAAQRQSAGTLHDSNNSKSSNVASPYPSLSGGGGGGFKPSVDQMIDAQKFASRAVSALQFYDYENAKKQLIAAMQILNGVNQ